jgi:hypothetical protein
MNEQQSTAIPARKIGDRIQFQVMPWLWPDGKSYKGTITDIIDTEDEHYYHVETMIGNEHVKDGIVYETEIVDTSITWNANVPEGTSITIQARAPMDEEWIEL